jgi:tetratricopeptide (TPR) repeat protein
MPRAYFKLIGDPPHMPDNPNARPVVVISSTALDLPQHRAQVLDACLRMEAHPEMMEHLPASNADALAESRRLVDKADIYLGVFAFRYGYVPEGSDISITEMEYNRAAERDIPRLIFLMRDDYPIKPSDVERGDGARKLDALKERLKKERVINYFGSPEDLRGLAIQSLVPYHKPDLTIFHYVSDIPTPPEEFIAHPYTLLQTHRLVGRQQELSLLTDWVAKPDSEVYKARILNVVAIGGLGKSALTWTWFNNIAPQEMNPLAGRMWWSFYESDATFENFVTRALAYVSRRPLDEVQQIPAPERESQLLAALDREPFLLVLDGLERILIAYARMDAARLEDGQVGNQRNLRKTADPRAGRFLKKLAQVTNSRILVSTRLYPAELETEGGDPIPGTFRRDIKGLSDEDAVELWRAFNVSGARDLLLPVFITFDKHPLLIQTLAGEVKRYRRAPGSFEEWRKANPRFDPTKFPHMQDAISHVLEFALRGLDSKAGKTLQIIAAFRMPATYDTLTALLVGKSKARFDLRTNKLVTEEGRLFDEERNLDATLTELEDRGLVGWDRRANRYDLHPIVRSVIWGGLGKDTRRGVYERLHLHFEALPVIDNPLNINSLEDLTTTIELYNTLIGLGRYDDAGELFYMRLNQPMFYRLAVNRQRVELLEMLFPDGLNQLPLLKSQDAQSFMLNALAQGYRFNGRLRHAAIFNRRANKIASELKHDNNLSVGLCELSQTLRLSAALRESETVARSALVITRERADRFQEAVSLTWLGLTLAARGIANDSKSALRRSLQIDIAQSHTQGVGFDYINIAQRMLWFGEFTIAILFANRAWELAQVMKLEPDFIRAARVQGAASLKLNDFAASDEQLHHALTRARDVNLFEEELPALVALAELRGRQGDLKAARELLDDVWEAAERGPYPLFHADACNVLAQVERDAGNEKAAVEAARRAYELAWCDGPPFAYHWGLEKARRHLVELGAEEPVMPAFDESKFEPMPEVEIDPADEFGAGAKQEGEE